MASCSAVQGDVLTAMHSLVDHALVAWPADDDEPPDQHYQALLLRAISIILLNPWIDDDQTGRRCLSLCLTCLHTTKLVIATMPQPA